jgi:HK97 family phage portal protein
MIIRSFGSLQTAAAPTPTYTHVSGPGYSGYAQTYAQIYRTQPNVRTMVDFLARNAAQLGIHVFRRVSDNDRERLADHDVANWLYRPNPSMTRYRLFESTMQDLGIYFNAFWLKVRRPDGLNLVRLPPEQMTIEGGLFPSSFTWTSTNGAENEFAPSEIVYFSGYDPSNPLCGLSPIETLRRILAEERAAQDHRASYWRNAARVEGVIERPKDAGKWTKEQRDAFRESWRGFQGRRNTGGTPVLEDGMTWKATAFSSKDSEGLASRKLTREECAAAYHIPQPMVGILEHATFSNIKEQHKHLYQDALGPWLVMMEEELERQLLPEASDTDRVYLEFNIAEKLKGSFEEQATAIMQLTGRPVMSVNEGRARLNLPSKDGEDDVAMPLNMTTNAAEAQPSEPDTAAAAQVIHAHWKRQQARLEKVPPDDRGATFKASIDRWNRELATDLVPVLGTAAERVAADVNARTVQLLDAAEPAFDRAVVIAA